MMDKKTILAVDDEPSILLAVEDTLNEKYTVITAKNGREAVKMAEKLRPDLIVMDVMMPEMDGFTALKTLRTQMAPSAPPVIFLSAKSGMADIEHGIELGGFDYIVKPFSPMKLLKKVDEVLERIAARKSMQQHKEP
jgi:DNA-binding response OmpR family regulator